MTSICFRHLFSNPFIYCSIVLLFHSTKAQLSCRNLDDRAIGPIDYDKLIGKFNVIYTSDPSGDTCQGINIGQRVAADAVRIEKFLTNGQSLKGQLQNLYSPRKTCTVGGRQSILYVLKTDYNFLLTYLCTNVGTDAFPQTKEFFRIVSRRPTIAESDLIDSTNILYKISPNIQLSPVNTGRVTQFNEPDFKVNIPTEPPTSDPLELPEVPVPSVPRIKSTSIFSDFPTLEQPTPRQPEEPDPRAPDGVRWVRPRIKVGLPKAVGIDLDTKDKEPNVLLFKPKVIVKPVERIDLDIQPPAQELPQIAQPVIAPTPPVVIREEPTQAPTQAPPPPPPPPSPAPTEAPAPPPTPAPVPVPAPTPPPVLHERLSVLVKERYCKPIEPYIVNNINLDKLSGKWLGHYSTFPNISDVWLEIERNPNLTSDYSHIMRIVNDEKVFTAKIRYDSGSGYIILKSFIHPFLDEIPAVYLWDEPRDHLVLYRCSEFAGRFTAFEKMGVYSRNCDLNIEVRDKAIAIAESIGVTERLVSTKQWNCFHNFKFQTKLLTDNCIQFHDSEIVEPQFERMSGQWDRHLISQVLHHSYDYAIITHNGNHVDYVVFPLGYHSRKSRVEGTNILKTITVTNRYAVLGNEAYISVNYDSYILKYSCAQYEEDGAFKIDELLMLSLRPQTTAQLSANPNIFAEILSRVPEKSLMKIQFLIARLTNPTNRAYLNFGETVINTINSRLYKFRLENSLSDRNDREVYKYLGKQCDHFDADEQTYFNLSTIVNSNWTLDYASSHEEKLSYDRFSVKQQNAVSYQVSLYNQNNLLAYSDRYYDKEDRIFWAYTEGRRSRKTYLLANNDYRVVYSCDERSVNGGLKAQEILRFYSLQNTMKPRDWFSYLEVLVANMKPKTLGKITDLLEKMRRAGLDNPSDPKVLPLKQVMYNFLTPKLQLEEQIRGKHIRTNRTDDECYASLAKSCSHFDDDELMEPDVYRLSGDWHIDWASWVDPTQEIGVHTVDFAPTSDPTVISSFTYFSGSKETEKKIILKSQYKKTKEVNKYYQKWSAAPTAPRGQFAFIWTDYDNFMVGHQCHENDASGDHEVLLLMSRIGTHKSRDLNSYFDVISKGLQQKTLSKIYHSLNVLKPYDANIVADDLKVVYQNLDSRGLQEQEITDRLMFAEDLYYRFKVKGLVVDKINKYITGKGYSQRSLTELLPKLTKMCRPFDESELIDVSPKITQAFAGSWTIDYKTRIKFKNNHYHSVVEIKGSDSYKMKLFSGSDLMDITEEKALDNSRWLQTSLPNDRHGLKGLLLLDAENAVIYYCYENDIDGVLTVNDGLLFLTRGINSTDLSVFLSKLYQTAKPRALSKIIDLISDLRPTDHNIRERERQFAEVVNKSLEPKLSERVAVNQVLQKKCQYFNQKDLVNPVFKRLLGQWRVRLANVNDFHKPFDTIEWSDATDRYFSKLRLGQKFQCKGPLKRVEETNYFEEVFDRKRALEAILYTDYTDIMVVYSCKENVNDPNLPVMENLKFLVKNDSQNVFTEKDDCIRIIETRLPSHVYSTVAQLVPTLKYMYIEPVPIQPVPQVLIPALSPVDIPSVNSHNIILDSVPVQRQGQQIISQGFVPLVVKNHPFGEVFKYEDHGSDGSTQIIQSQSQWQGPPSLSNVNQQQYRTGRVMSDSFNKLWSQLSSLEKTSSSSSMQSQSQITGIGGPPIPSQLPEAESCPDLEFLAQKNVDFQRMCGHWVATHTSNTKWDRDCISSDDFFDPINNTITQNKYTNGKSHKVFIRHTRSSARQQTIVDNIVFDSWILATDYDNYKLSYTCYVKEIKGVKRKIDLQRLYTRNIEAKDFDESVLAVLREKSALIGKGLDPIDRSKCPAEQPVAQQTGTF